MKCDWPFFFFPCQGKRFPRKLNLKGNVTSLLQYHILVTYPDKHLNEIQRHLLLRVAANVHPKPEGSENRPSQDKRKIPFDLCCRWCLAWFFLPALIDCLSSLCTMWDKFCLFKNNKRVRAFLRHIVTFRPFISDSCECSIHAKNN